jgi:hypothetical protein
MKRIMLFLVLFMAIGVTSYAANGDLTVTGSGINYPDGSRQSYASGILNGMQKYYIAGTYTFIVPTGVSRLLLQLTGGGGGAGGGFDASGSGDSYYPGGDGGYGGGGGFFWQPVTVIPGQSYTVIVGAGGVGGQIGGNGSAGGDTSFGGAVNIAKGGTGGNGTNAGSSNGTGGTGGGWDGYNGSPYGGGAPNGRVGGNGPSGAVKITW